MTCRSQGLEDESETSQPRTHTCGIQQCQRQGHKFPKPGRTSMWARRHCLHSEHTTQGSLPLNPGFQPAWSSADRFDRTSRSTTATASKSPWQCLITARWKVTRQVDENLGEIPHKRKCVAWKTLLRKDTKRIEELSPLSLSHMKMVATCTHRHK